MLSLFSKLLRYPTQSIRKDTIQLIKAIENAHDLEHPSEINDYLKVFYYYLEKTNLLEQEEVYTQTFEVQSITTLDTGYILFGDDYKRAELLVNLNKEYTKLGINTGKELGDYLPNVLLLLESLKDTALRDDIINYIVYPAINKMISEFDTRLIEKKNEVYLKHQKALIEKSKEFRDIYVNILVALKLFLEKKFNAREIKIQSHPAGFFSSIEQEMNIEKLNN